MSEDIQLGEYFKHDEVVVTTKAWEPDVKKGSKGKVIAFNPIDDIYTIDLSECEKSTATMPVVRAIDIKATPATVRKNKTRKKEEPKIESRAKRKVAPKVAPKKAAPKKTNKTFEEFFDKTKSVLDEEVENDVVNHPSHYTQGSIETWDYIIAQNMGYLEGNVCKYISRFRYKNGLEDLYKAKAYLDKLIEVEENRE
jgi:hypothetical protein